MKEGRKNMKERERKKTRSKLTKNNRSANSPKCSTRGKVDIE